jgi:hypothetical protein
MWSWLYLLYKTISPFLDPEGDLDLTSGSSFGGSGGGGGWNRYLG